MRGLFFFLLSGNVDLKNGISPLHTTDRYMNNKKHIMKQEALKLVEDLNNEIEDGGGLDYYLPFEFKSYGWNNSAIYFMGLVLWTEDNDEREYLTESDQKESLRTYVIREAEKILKDLNLKMGAF